MSEGHEITVDLVRERFARLKRAELLADLMDAVHDLPPLIDRWPSCNEQLLRGMLQAFDHKWPDSGIALLATYDAALAGRPSRSGRARSPSR